MKGKREMHILKIYAIIK